MNGLLQCTLLANDPALPYSGGADTRIYRSKALDLSFDVRVGVIGQSSIGAACVLTTASSFENAYDVKATYPAINYSWSKDFDTNIRLIDSSALFDVSVSIQRSVTACDADMTAAVGAPFQTTADTVCLFAQSLDVQFDTLRSTSLAPAILATTYIDIRRPWFFSNIWNMLPAVYRERDNGDLDVMLRLFSEALDMVKTAIDGMTTMHDLYRCNSEILPLVAYMLNRPFDPAKDTEVQRHDLIDAIEHHRQKGTLPSILRGLEALGWRGYLEETFRNVLRLNMRGGLNRQRLSGPINNHGVLRVITDAYADGVRAEVESQRPAGVRVFYLENLVECVEPIIGLSPITSFVSTLAQTARNNRFTTNFDRTNGVSRLTSRTALTASTYASISSSTRHTPHFSTDVITCTLIGGEVECRLEVGTDVS